MRAIQIDTKNKTVKEVDYKGGLESIYAYVNCKTVDRFYINEDCCYIDDEGLFNSPDLEFIFNGQVYCGNGLIVGTGSQGEDIEPSLSLDEAKRLISFPTLIHEKWMMTFLSEKNISLDETIDGYINVRTLLNSLAKSSEEIQNQIKDILVHMDFVNKDPMILFKDIVEQNR